MKKYPISTVHEVGWASGLLWMACKISFPPGLNPRIVPSLASRYTDYAIPAAEIQSSTAKIHVVRMKTIRKRNMSKQVIQ
jgi:hypothetical protein